MGCKYYSLFLELVECEYGMFGRRQKKSKSGQAAVAAKIKQNLLGQQSRKPVSSKKKILWLCFFGKK
jgi:hypothetical protein